MECFGGNIKPCCKKMSFNPWQVDSIQEFYVLKCPECTFIHQEESSFQEHAVENHPLSAEFFGKKAEEGSFKKSTNEKKRKISTVDNKAGLSSLGVPEVPWHPQILADQLTLFQPRGADYAHQIILAPPDFQTFLRP